MTKIKCTSSELIFPGMLSLVILCLTFASPTNFVQGMLFLLFQVFGIWLPGRAIIDFLYIKDINSVEKAVWGYAFGYIINIIQYFLLAIFQCLGIIKWTQMGVTCVAAISVCIKLKRNAGTQSDMQIKKDARQWIPISLFLAVTLLIRFFTYYGRNVLPTNSLDVTFPTQDILFYIGNAISSMKGLPIEEFRFAGERFYYHYLGSVQLGVVSSITGIDALTLEICFGWIQPLFLLIPSFWCLLRRMGISYNKKLLGLFILLFTTGWELVVYVAYQHIMYVTPFGWDVGLAFGILVLTFMYIQHQHSKIQWGVWLAVLLTFFLCEGSKAPIAVIILCVLGCVCLLWLVEGKGKHVIAFIYGFPLLFVFLLVFFGIVSNGFNTITTNASGLKFTLTGHIYECGLGNMYFDWTSRGIPEILGKILVFVLYFAGCNLVTYYMFVINGVRLLCRKKGILSFEGCLMLGVCCGLILTLITKQSGNSQMYFAMTAFPIAIVFSLKMWNNLRYRNKLYFTGLCVALALSVLCFIQILSPSIEAGYKKIVGEGDFSQESNSLTYEELQAYQWIRDNTEEDVLCVSNVVGDDKQYQSFIVGVCTERQLYMEGWRYVVGVMNEETVMRRREEVKKFFMGGNDEKNKLMKAGVSYVIWTKRYGSLSEESENFFGEKIFDNEAVKIYKLVDNTVFT